MCTDKWYADYTGLFKVLIKANMKKRPTKLE